MGCEPSIVSHGRIPYNVLILEKSIRLHEIPTLASQIAQDVHDQTKMT